MLQVSYDSTELKAICLNQEVADRWLDRVHAEKLTILLADAEACGSAQEWCDILGDDFKNVASDAFAVRLGSRYTLEFAPVDRYRECYEDGSTNWGTVEFIKLVRITERT